MKNFVVGLLIGAVICAAAGFVYLPKLKEKLTAEGVEMGKKLGSEESKVSGIQEGIAQAEAKIETIKKQIVDSFSAEISKIKEAQRPKIVVEKKPEIQNWRVLGGQIADPIVDDANNDKSKNQ